MGWKHDAFSPYITEYQYVLHFINTALEELAV